MGKHARTGLWIVLIIAAFVLGVWFQRTLDDREGRVAVDASTPSGPAEGYWREGRRPREEELTEEERSRLVSVPYLQGSQPARADAGVTIHDPAVAHAGLNLIVSGHGTEAILTDMSGRTLHRWSMAVDEAKRVLPEPPPRIFWRRAQLLDDGDLLVVFEYMGLVRLDVDSRLVWALPERAHHDIDVDGEGRIYVLTQHLRLNPLTSARNVIGDDRITILGPDGRKQEEVSVLDSFVQSPYAAMLDALREEGDVFHTNTIQVFDGSRDSLSPLFRAGNLLISVRELNTVAILDRESRRVVWALTGLWRKQHEPLLLDNGHMLVFDNYAGFETSRVIEFDPWTQEIFWRYEGSREQPFFSDIGGSNQRLPNGNTLLIESVFGRAVEVTPDGRIVWEYINPHRAGEHDELIATLFDVVRIDAASPLVSFLGGN